MMPNVTRGERMGGLMRYLAGPGKANEHTNPHLVGGDDTLMSWFGREELSAGDAQLVARHLDAPRVEAEALLGDRAPQVKGGHVWHCSLSLAATEGLLSDDQWQQIASDFMAEMQWRVDAADTGTSMDELGAAAARGQATRVGGTSAAGARRGLVASTAQSAPQGAAHSAVESPGQGDSGLAVVGRTPTVLRWAAVRHGVSKNGNDHVHLVVNLVAEGGAVANPYRDFLRAQSASRTLERRHGLVQLPSAARGQSVRGWKPAEQQAAARRTAVARVENARRHRPLGYLGVGMSQGWSDMDAAARKAAVAGTTKSSGGALGEAMGMDQPRRVLEIAVRGASTASRTEDEFVRRLREAGVLVRPRYKEGSTEEVAGFSVALAPRYSSSLGEHPVWYGGGRLARDLTLPRLRSGWEHPEGTTPAAAAEWKAAARARRTVAPASARREAKRFSPRAMSIQAERVADMSRRLAQVPAQRRPEWAKVAGASAGTLSAWAMSAARSSDAQVAAMAPTLAAAAQTLAVSASTVAAQPRSTTMGTTAMTGMAMLLASAARGGQGAMGQAVLVTQMVSLLEAVIQMAAERRELDTVLALRTGVADRLTGLSQALAGQERRSAAALLEARRATALAVPGQSAMSATAPGPVSAPAGAPGKSGPPAPPAPSSTGGGARRRARGERPVAASAAASAPAPTAGATAAPTTAATTAPATAPGTEPGTTSARVERPQPAQENAPTTEDPHTTAMQNLRRQAAQQAAQEAARGYEYE